ncbi:MAG: cyclic nucleotide-binding domain-containing protein [Bdellovibrionaceae bacterium]|nr:cyclic nucleotide-binding domain-containing protein [Pseudobdellovibrionaceae bacterium]
MSQHLSGVYLFKELTPDELKIVAHAASERHLSPGEEVFMTGEAAKSFFVITLGSVKIYSNSSKGDAMGIANLGSGAHFGEMPFFDQGNRSATAQTLEPTHMLEIAYADLEALFAAHPLIALKVYRTAARFMATRLRNTLGDLNQAKESKLKAG